MLWETDRTPEVRSGKGSTCTLFECVVVMKVMKVVVRVMKVMKVMKRTIEHTTYHSHDATPP